MMKLWMIVKLWMIAPIFEGIMRKLKKSRDPKRVPYTAVYVRGAEPGVKLTIETQCFPNQPIDEPDLIDLMQVLRRSGWTKQ